MYKTGSLVKILAYYSSMKYPPIPYGGNACTADGIGDASKPRFFNWKFGQIVPPTDIYLNAVFASRETIVILQNVTYLI